MIPFRLQLCESAQFRSRDRVAALFRRGWPCRPAIILRREYLRSHAGRAGI